MNGLQGRGLDLEYDTESRQSSHDTVPEPAMYETAYVTSHKANCRAGAFNAEGSLVATGSVDTSIKILDVDRMLAKSQIESMASGNKTIDPGKGTIQPGLRLVPSGNFFLALSRSHHFLLKRVRI